MSKEDPELIEFIKGHKLPLMILAFVAFAVLFPYYRVLFPGASAPPPLPIKQTVAVSTPESAEPVNAFDGGVGKGNGRFLKPRGMTSDNAGNIYVADTENGRVQKFDATGKFVLAFGTKARGDNPDSKPIGIAVDRSGNIYVTDLANGSLIKFNPDGKFVSEWKGPDPGFYGPLDIALGPDDQLYIVDSGRVRIVRFDPGRESFTAWGIGGSGPGQFSGGTGITVGANQIFVADLGNDRVEVFDLNGTFLREWAVPVWEKYPWHYPDMIVDEMAKTIYLTNGWKNQILAFDLDGNSVKGELPSDLVATLSNPSSLMITEIKNERRMIVLNTEGSKLSSFNLQSKPRK